jgi:hypothetical protein
MPGEAGEVEVGEVEAEVGIEGVDATVDAGVGAGVGVGSVTGIIGTRADRLRRGPGVEVEVEVVLALVLRVST